MVGSQDRERTGVSLFAGAGGMDVGFHAAGVRAIFANELDRDAVASYEANWPGVMRPGDIEGLLGELAACRDQAVDLVFGGPPCQGFSVAGKMDPNDKRSALIWRFLDAVSAVMPLGFVCENVKALGKLAKWRTVRDRFLNTAHELGYSCDFVVLNASEYGVPQGRERVFFFGSRFFPVNANDLLARLSTYKEKAPTVREAIYHLGPAGSDRNPATCAAKVTLAAKPVLRKSPYAGMMFNGLGRPLNLDGVSATLPASMGGNKTPIVDELLLHGTNAPDWVGEYHAHLRAGGSPRELNDAPPHLRRLTLLESAAIQTFPPAHRFEGGKSSVYRQIGNAVPCKLAHAVARAAIDVIENRPLPTLLATKGKPQQRQLTFR